MTLTFPDWLKNNFVDVEQLMIDMFSKVFPGLLIGVWEADDWTDESEQDPLLTFVRLPGGQVCYEQNYDECLIQATAYTLDREDSNRMINAIRAIMLPIQGLKFTMNDGYTAQITCAEEVSGPQLLTVEQQIDSRVVPATFRIRVKLRDRTRYDNIISGL